MTVREALQEGPPSAPDPSDGPTLAEDHFRAAWNRFFEIWSSGRGEALFRVGFGCLLLVELVGLRSKLDLFFVAGGAHPVTPFEALYTAPAVHAVYWVWTGVVVLLVLGVFVRSMSVANFCAVVYFFGLRGSLAPHAADWIMHAMAFCLIFMHSDRHLTLGHLWRKPQRQTAVPGWPLRIAQLSCAGIFLTAGLSKLPDPAWRSGGALESALLSPLVARLDLAWIQGYSGVLAVLGVGTVLWEIAFPAMLCFRRLRPWALLSAIAFLLAIDLTVRVGWFAWFAIAFLAVFYDELWPGARVRVEREPPRLSIPVHGFLALHTLAFGITMTGYAAAGLTARSPAQVPWLRMPIVSEYVRYVAGIRYYDVWPSRFVVAPPGVITYDAGGQNGEVRAIPPFDDAGALLGGPGPRDARDGLLRRRAAMTDLSPSGWEAYAEHLSDRYARHYRGDCPVEIHFYRVVAPAPGFGVQTTLRSDAWVPIVTAHFACPGRTMVELAFQ